MEFKEKLKTLRKEKKLSQQKLADAIFVSRSAVAKWENGLGLPSHDSLEALTHFFEVEDDYFTVGPAEETIVEKNKKILLLEIALVLLILIASGTVLALFFRGYSLSAEAIIGDSYPGQHTFTAGEYTFSGVLWDVEGSDSGMFQLFQAVKKTGFLYHNDIDSSSRSYLYTKDGHYVAYWDCFEGKEHTYYFLRYTQTINVESLGDFVDGDSDNVETTYPLLSETIKLNGKEIKLQMWSYFEYDELIESVEIQGEELEIRKE